MENEAEYKKEKAKYLRRKKTGKIVTTAMTVIFLAVTLIRSVIA